MSGDDVLDVMRESGALLEGHFELRSGLHSERFFQCANLLRYPTKAGPVCHALAEKLRNTVSLEGLTGVVSPALGGIVVGHEVARRLGTQSIFVEKQNDVVELRRFKINPGERWLVAEDVVTRGGRVQETVDIVRECGASVVAVGVIVDRSAGRAAFGTPLVSLVEVAPVVFEAAACPRCAAGSPVIHPGS